MGDRQETVLTQDAFCRARHGLHPVFRSLSKCFECERGGRTGCRFIGMPSTLLYNTYEISRTIGYRTVSPPKEPSEQSIPSFNLGMGCDPVFRQVYNRKLGPDVAIENLVR
jgi:hypothetical protein